MSSTTTPTTSSTSANTVPPQTQQPTQYQTIRDDWLRKMRAERRKETDNEKTIYGGKIEEIVEVFAPTDDELKDIRNKSETISNTIEEIYGLLCDMSNTGKDLLEKQVDEEVDNKIKKKLVEFNFSKRFVPAQISINTLFKKPMDFGLEDDSSNFLKYDKIYENVIACNTYTSQYIKFVNDILSSLSKDFNFLKSNLLMFKPNILSNEVNKPFYIQNMGFSIYNLLYIFALQKKDFETNKTAFLQRLTQNNNTSAYQSFVQSLTPSVALNYLNSHFKITSRSQVIKEINNVAKFLIHVCSVEEILKSNDLNLTMPDIMLIDKQNIQDRVFSFFSVSNTSRDWFTFDFMEQIGASDSIESLLNNKRFLSGTSIDDSTARGDSDEENEQEAKGGKKRRKGFGKKLANLKGYGKKFKGCGKPSVNDFYIEGGNLYSSSDSSDDEYFETESEMKKRQKANDEKIQKHLNFEVMKFNTPELIARNEALNNIFAPFLQIITIKNIGQLSNLSLLNGFNFSELADLKPSEILDHLDSFEKIWPILDRHFTGDKKHKKAMDVFSKSFLRKDLFVDMIRSLFILYQVMESSASDEISFKHVFKKYNAQLFPCKMSFRDFGLIAILANKDVCGEGLTSSSTYKKMDISSIIFEYVLNPVVLKPHYIALLLYIIGLFEKIFEDNEDFMGLDDAGLFFNTVSTFYKKVRTGDYGERGTCIMLYMLIKISDYLFLMNSTEEIVKDESNAFTQETNELLQKAGRVYLNSFEEFEAIIPEMLSFIDAFQNSMSLNLFDLDGNTQIEFLIISQNIMRTVTNITMNVSSVGSIYESNCIGISSSFIKDFFTLLYAIVKKEVGTFSEEVEDEDGTRFGLGGNDDDNFNFFNELMNQIESNATCVLNESCNKNINKVLNNNFENPYLYTSLLHIMMEIIPPCNPEKLFIYSLDQSVNINKLTTLPIEDIKNYSDGYTNKHMAGMYSKLVKSGNVEEGDDYDPSKKYLISPIDLKIDGNHIEKIELQEFFKRNNGNLVSCQNIFKIKFRPMYDNKDGVFYTLRFKQLNDNILVYNADLPEECVDFLYSFLKTSNNNTPLTILKICNKPTEKSILTEAPKLFAANESHQETQLNSSFNNEDALYSLVILKDDDLNKSKMYTFRQSLNTMFAQCTLQNIYNLSDWSFVKETLGKGQGYSDDMFGSGRKRKKKKVTKKLPIIESDACNSHDFYTDDPNGDYIRLVDIPNKFTNLKKINENMQYSTYVGPTNDEARKKFKINNVMPNFGDKCEEGEEGCEKLANSFLKKFQIEGKIKTMQLLLTELNNTFIQMNVLTDNVYTELKDFGYFMFLYQMSMLHFTHENNFRYYFFDGQAVSTINNRSKYSARVPVGNTSNVDFPDLFFDDNYLQISLDKVNNVLNESDVSAFYEKLKYLRIIKHLLNGAAAGQTDFILKSVGLSKNINNFYIYIFFMFTIHLIRGSL